MDFKDVPCHILQPSMADIQFFHTSTVDHLKDIYVRVPAFLNVQNSVVTCAFHMLLVSDVIIMLTCAKTSLHCCLASQARE